MEELPHGAPPMAVRAQLRRILDSPDFQASERNRRFLKYVVEEALAGRAKRIKAYSVATEAFGREESFDPQADPIVRIEASRLRRALERYYLIAGANDLLRITIPKGSYAPAFEAAGDTHDGLESRSPTEGAEARPPVPARDGASRRLARIGLWVAAFAGLVVAGLAAAWSLALPPFAREAVETQVARQGPAILVTAFAEEGDGVAFPNFMPGFTRALVVGLTRFNDLFVFGPETSFRYGQDADPPRLVADLDVDFVLTGGATVSGQRFAVDALLVDAKSGQYLWASRFEGALDAGDIFRVRDEIADRVARSLAQPYGVIFANRVAETEGKLPKWLSSYDCVIRFYGYWKSFRRDNYASIRACLEQAVESDPDYAEAHAALSMVHSDAYRFGFDDGAISGDPRQSALALARRAIGLAPDAARGYHALSIAYWLMNDVESSLNAGRRGLALNPNDTEVMSELGIRLAWRMEWDEALPLLREAYARNPGQPTGYRLALFLHHYLNGRYPEALAEARKIDMPDVIYGHIAMAMVSARLGKERVAGEAVERILAIVPDYGGRIVSDLEKRNIHPDIIAAVVDGLRLAGMPMPEAAPPEKF